MNSARTLLLRMGSRLLRTAGVRSVGVLVFAEYLAQGFGIFTGVIAARALGPEDYGRVAMILAFPSAVLSFASFKSIDVSVRYFSVCLVQGERERARAIAKLCYLTDFVAFTSASLLVLVGAPLFARRVYGEAWMVWPMGIYALSFPFFAIRNNSYAILTALAKFNQLATLEVAENVVELVLVVLFILVGLGPSGVVLGMAVSHMVVALCALGLALLVLREQGIGPWWVGSLANLKGLWRELSSFFAWNYLIRTLSGVVSQAPIIMLGSARGTEEAGYLRLALSVTGLVSIPLSASDRVVYPFLSRLWGRQEIHLLMEKVARWLRRQGLLLATFPLVMVFLLQYAIPLVFGSEYAKAIPGIQVLLIALVIKAYFFWLNSYYYAFRKLNIWTIGFALYTGFVLLAGWGVLQQWGYWGMCFVLAIGQGVFTISMAVKYFIDQGHKV